MTTIGDSWPRAHQKVCQPSLISPSSSTNQPISLSPGALFANVLETKEISVRNGWSSSAEILY
jgi:hypothetical protein